MAMNEVSALLGALRCMAVQDMFAESAGFLDVVRQRGAQEQLANAWLAISRHVRLTHEQHRSELEHWAETSPHVPASAPMLDALEQEHERERAVLQLSASTLVACYRLGQQHAQAAIALHGIEADPMQDAREVVCGAVMGCAGLAGDALQAWWMRVVTRPVNVVYPKI